MGQSVDDQQLSILWTKAALVSISLAGFINVIDPELGQLKKASNFKHMNRQQLVNDAVYLLPRYFSLCSPYYFSILPIFN